MTLTGTVNKTAILLALTLITALWVWNNYFQLQDPAAVQPYMLGGVIGGLIFGLITIFAKKAAPFTKARCMPCAKDCFWAGSPRFTTSVTLNW